MAPVDKPAATGKGMTDNSGQKKPGGDKIAATAQRQPATGEALPHDLDVATMQARPAPDAPLEEIIGRVKWFDTARGFGFISRTDGPDVMLHAATLRREGRSAIREGALVTCIAARGARGLHVVRLIAIDESDAPNPAESALTTHVKITPESGLKAATVKWFNRLRGFGFVTCGEGEPDVFVHMEVARRCGMLALRPGQAVAVRYGSGPHGLMATEVYPLEDVASTAAVRH